MKNRMTHVLARVLTLAVVLAVLIGGAALADDTPAHTKAITGSGDNYTITLNVTGQDKSTSSTSTTVTNGHADIVLVIDVTSSMSTTMSDGKTRLAAIQSAATQFVSGLNEDASSNITLVTFGMTSTSGNTPVWTNLDWSAINSATKTSLNNTINSLTLHSDNYSYDTTYAPGLNAANEQLGSSKVSSDGNNKYVIFFSDGDASDSQATINNAANAVKAKATVFSIGLPATYWYQSNDKIESVASDSSKYFEASNSAEMVNAFNSALQTIKTETTVSTIPMTDVVISDTLSEYVEMNGTATVSASDGSAVSATPKVSGKTVSVTIPEAKDGVTYTLSIPVKPTQKAQDEANAANTETSKFPSNVKASLSYDYDDESFDEEYGEKPEIEVAKQTFTVTWKDEDGTVLETDENVAYGTTPSYDGETPTKTATAEKTYTFDGWDKDIVAVTGDMTYTAKYKETINAYTVTWKNEDGTVLETDENVAYGTTPSYDGETPTKAATAEKTYTFNGWTPTISAVAGDVTYTATYTETTNTYTVKFVNNDGTELSSKAYDYGTKAADIAVPSTPEYAGTKEDGKTYTFTGWDKTIADVTGNATYTATYTTNTNTYTITWKNNDGSTIDTTTVAHGETPTHTDPTKAEDENNTYAFAGWTPEIVAATADAEYTATFIATPKATKPDTYTVTWKNYDGTTLAIETYQEGQTPSYKGSDPVKPADGTNTYAHSGWEPEVVAVTGDATYTATYTATEITYPTDPTATKKLTVDGKPDGSAYDKVTFNFNIATTDEDAPAIGTNGVVALSMDFETKNETFGIPVTNALASYEGWTDDVDYKDFTYTISEQQSGFPTVEGTTKSEYASDSYTMKVCVVKIVEGEGESAVTTYKASEITIAKQGEDEKQDSFEFTNEYAYSVPTTTLTVSKTVSGKETTDRFNFTIQFTAAADYGSVNPKVGDTVPTDSGLTAGEEKAYDTAITFSLAHDESVTFTVPKGTTYMVTESAATDYKPSVTVTSAAGSETSSGEKGNQLTTTGAADADGGNSAAFTNTYVQPSVPLTGVIEKNAPYLILAGIAVLAFVLYVVDRRRKATRK